MKGKSIEVVSVVLALAAGPALAGEKMHDMKDMDSHSESARAAVHKATGMVKGGFGYRSGDL